MSNTENKISVLKMIADDMENDAKEFEGKPFNGRTVAAYLGNLGAGIAALANITRSILEDESPNPPPADSNQQAEDEG